MEKSSKIKLILLIILSIILVLLIIANIYFFYKKDETISFKSSNLDQNVTNNTSNVENQSVKNTSISNSISNTTETNSVENSITVNFSDGLDTDELKDFIEKYSVGIQRISFDEENLESNTILLFIAKQYFDSNTNKSSLDVNTQYASTVQNIHTFLSELTGKDYSNVKYIPSYANYIGYLSSSNSYVFGQDYNNIKKEVYNCSNLSILDEENGLYTAKADVSRTIDDEITNYEITFTFTINQKYTYAKYCIKSLKIKNTSFYPDNTIHLVDNE